MRVAWADPLGQHHGVSGPGRAAYRGRFPRCQGGHGARSPFSRRWTMVRSVSLTRAKAAFQATGPTFSAQVFQPQQMFVPPLVPRAVVQDGPQTLICSVQVGEPGVMAGVDVGVWAGQAEQEVRSAAALRVGPGAGHLVLAVHSRGLPMAPDPARRRSSRRRRRLGPGPGRRGHRPRTRSAKRFEHACRAARRCFRECPACAAEDAPPCHRCPAGPLEWRPARDPCSGPTTACVAVRDAVGQRATRGRPVSPRACPRMGRPARPSEVGARLQPVRPGPVRVLWPPAPE